MLSVCNVTGHYSLKCNQDILSIEWNTDRLYKFDVVELPDKIRTQLAQRLIQKGVALPIVVIDKLPP